MITKRSARMLASLGGLMSLSLLGVDSVDASDSLPQSSDASVLQAVAVAQQLATAYADGDWDETRPLAAFTNGEFEEGFPVPEPPDEASLQVARATFVEDVTIQFGHLGELHWVACASEPDWIAEIRCYGVLTEADDNEADTIGRYVGVVEVGGWINDQGDFDSLHGPQLLPYDPVGVDSADDIRLRAEEYVTTYEFEVDAELFGRVANPRCETPESTETGEIFECRVDMVTNQNTFTMTVRFRITEGGGILATRVDFAT